MDMNSLIRKCRDMVVNVFLKEGGWRYARSLYLIGGFARDEGTAALSDDVLQVYNDMDFVAVVRRKTPACLWRLSRIQRQLNNGRFQFQVDLVLASERELRRPLSTILNYDIQRHHVFLWGHDFFGIDKPRVLSAGDILESDALQLLLNRQASLMIGYASLREDGLDSYVQVQISKALLAMMCSMLIAEGRYTVKVRDQLAIVESERNSRSGDSLWEAFADDDIMELLRVAVEFKHHPAGHHFRPFLEKMDFVAERYSRFLRSFMIHYYRLPADVGGNAVIEAFIDSQPVALNFLRPGWWAARLRGSKPGTMFFSVHPEVKVYARHMEWLEDHVAHREENDRRGAELAELIKDWKTSGFGCRIR